MKRLATVVVLCALLAVGCAHGKQSASGPTPSDKPAQAPASVQTAQKSTEPGTEAPGSPAIATGAGKDDLDFMAETPSAETATIADPIEPFNRAMFQFNDRLYFWVLKPVSQGYNVIVPEPARVSVSNFFYNLRYPVRGVSCILQIDFECFVIESVRFIVNTTLGIAGLFDPASHDETLRKQDRDLGQTMGIYGVGPGFYIVWPVLGPSSPRDSVGLVGDFFLYPISYLNPWYVWLGVRSYQEVNATSLTIGDYEVFKEAAIDPYVSMRNAWVQYRQKKVEERGSREELKAPPGAPKY